MGVELNLLMEEIKKFRFWYHKIDLGDGVITPGLDLDPLWNMIRETRGSIDYRGKKVLDLASFDGMWAFEAEKLGADLVVATDCYYDTFKNFLFCRDTLKSKVIPYYNVSPYNLYSRLDVFLRENWGEEKPFNRLFDIVHHLGLLYHLRDPMLSLSQSRSVMKKGGLLLLETAAVLNEKSSFMVFNGVPTGEQHIYKDITTWWAPTIPCLKEMLSASMFEPLEDSIKVLDNNTLDRVNKILKRYLRPRDNDYKISRVCLVAKARGRNDLDAEYYRELARTYRNPGLETEIIER